MHIKTTLKDYTDACIKFAEYTKDWENLSEGKSYVTYGNGEWFEYSGKQHGGLNVRWAFRMLPPDIKVTAPFELGKIFGKAIRIHKDSNDYYSPSRDVPIVFQVDNNVYDIIIK